MFASTPGLLPSYGITVQIGQSHLAKDKAERQSRFHPQGLKWRPGFTQICGNELKGRPDPRLLTLSFILSAGLPKAKVRKSRMDFNAVRGCWTEALHEPTII